MLCILTNSVLLKLKLTDFCEVVFCLMTGNEINVLPLPHSPAMADNKIMTTTRDLLC